LVEHDVFGKPVSAHRVKPEGMLFRIMLYSVGAPVRSTGGGTLVRTAVASYLLGDPPLPAAPGRGKNAPV
jgi:hypothetical protein